MSPLSGAGRRGDAADLTELKNLVLLHAQAQGIPSADCAQLLWSITSDGAGSAGSWVDVWSSAAKRHLAAGDYLLACRHFNMARFPFVDGPERGTALSECVDAFQNWATTRQITREEVVVGDRHMPFWLSASPRGRAAPALIVVGGIVSIKEQWGELLPTARRLGMTVACAELPGVGESNVRYDGNAWRIFPALLDRLAELRGTSEAYVLAMSFGGNLAIRAAVHDDRLRGICTVGAPISKFFTDGQWWSQLPGTTLRTLAHLTGHSVDELQDRIADWALTDAELSQVHIPVRYVASRRDEIIPAADPALVRQLIRDSEVLEHDDVHGSPQHLLETRLWLVRSLLSMRGATVVPAALGLALNLLGLRDRIRGCLR
ncbi:alpha/beta fold hydrolase [Streptomyces sp. NEAU-S7GS2]|uniref:alpha/beta fold hydrolase n=1 Tax=Streptomyces sp. NEAU-S7GS2 TaxID=2202000 RepID=UPI000D7048A4|nr:alpha/beta fold hydrolase [Streptomyces sp. NEAU-S7GS2]AWN27783.1 alpha/beta hydrolase [Streptomyces sp. NEAU-S7GS2]